MVYDVIPFMGSFQRPAGENSCFSMQDVPCIGSDIGSNTGVSVSGVIEIYDEHELHGKAGVRDGNQVYRLYGIDIDGKCGVMPDLVLLPAAACHLYLAGSMVLHMHIYDRKSTSQIYAGV